MGPMGPMAPTVGSWGCGGAAWLWLTLIVLGAAALGLVAVVLWRDAVPKTRNRARSPEALLDERFARGELSQERYRAALTDILKGRYVRGELELEAYEARLERLLDSRSAHVGQTGRSSGRPRAASGEPTADEG